ncbi:hypothetical protein CTEN210_11912 [Chaetoceros tenuissimus]|uniref:Prolyl 4-hydroxylase alpha subunit Fe(2+) 2OG dioxygenase domain-containing protein n=1 Tax=Chaetoceros tenuissimus TaxID=426638 RepID=A0AAD3D083_9STRA|nr:hypothetical protein CTEN210_11912 [Chaetoceros tenuissimus]
MMKSTTRIKALLFACISALHVNVIQSFIVPSPFKASKWSLAATEKKRSDVQIFDNVFSSKACDMIHELAVEHYERTNDGSSTFIRPPYNTRPLTPIEHAIDSVLTCLNDENQIVEYWSRSEYMNIDTHADIDEALLENEDLIKCPEMGHVLYLQVEKGLRGPTTVFPNVGKGWSENNSTTKEMVIVPAVQGRILRFPGSAMHAVPKPADRWTMNREEEKILRSNEDNDCTSDEYNECANDEYNDDEEEYFDEDDFDDFDDYEEFDEDVDVDRSVLLFNTWKAPGPIAVTGDIAVGALPEGIELSQADIDAYLKSQEEILFSQWEEDYGVDGEYVRSNAIHDWNSIDIQTIEENVDTEKCTLNISLMGLEKRRLYPKKYVEVETISKEQVKDAFNQESIPSSIEIIEKS